jgi:periplasmic divalent cation tolerance protein
MSYIEVRTTTEKKEDAERIASIVLEKRLGACVQIVGPIESHYWWQGQLTHSPEWLCLIKTRTDQWEALLATIRAVHPYSVPEILAVPILMGSADYLTWLDDAVNPSAG